MKHEIAPMRRYAMRRDENEPELVKTARRLGVQMEQFGPLDWWASPRREAKFVPIEIKDPSRRGHKDEFEPRQLRFFERCRQYGSEYRIWYTEQDVLDFVGARRTS